MWAQEGPRGSNCWEQAQDPAQEALLDPENTGVLSLISEHGEQIGLCQPVASGPHSAVRSPQAGPGTVTHCSCWSQVHLGCLQGSSGLKPGNWSL